MIAAHLALVGHTREASGAGQHRKQRQLRQRYRGRAVVDQHDVIGRKRELVAAASCAAIDHANGGNAGTLAGVLDPIPGLVGELAEIDLVRVRGAREHTDIGAGTEHAWLGRAQEYDLDRRMLEAQALDGIRKLNIDAEIVGVELELVALEQRALLVDVHQQSGHFAINFELPVAIARRISLEIDPGLAIAQPALCIRHFFLTTAENFPGGRPWPSRLHGDRATAGYRTPRPPAASPAAPPGAARGAYPATSQPRPGSSTPSVQPRSGASCRTGRLRPARSASARGCAREHR